MEKVTKFAIITGDGSVDGGSIFYKGNNSDLIVKSSETFSSGSLQFKAKFSSLASGLLVVLKTQDGNVVLCGSTISEHKFVIATVIQDQGWNKPSIAGNLSNYKVGATITFRIEVDGSKIKLLIDEVIMCENVAVLKDAPIEFKAASDDNIEIFDIEVEKEKSEIFVAVQFSSEYYALYDEIIEPIVTEFNFKCVRGDKIYTPTPILKDLTESILNSVAIIADITPDNPNVFYEIGYSHAIGKPTILLCDKQRLKIPFDLSGFRTIYYENSLSGKNKVEATLREFLRNL